MACPHVSGAAALILSADPTKKASAVLQQLLDDAYLNVLSNLKSSDTNALLCVAEGGAPPTPTPQPTPAPPPTPPPPPAGPGTCCWHTCGGGNCQGGWCGESRGNCEGNCNGHFCPAASLASTQLRGETVSGSPVAQHGRLSVAGNKIVGENGDPVHLRGMSFFWSQWQGKYYTQAVVDWLVDDWQCSLVRAVLGIHENSG